MGTRAALLPILMLSAGSVGAQTVLTAVEYEVLKSHDQLPAGPIVISGQTQPASAPADWVLNRGGGDLCGCWVEPDVSYTVAMAPNDDGSSDTITLPFSFNLFGDSYSTLFINNNGNISFDAPYGTYTASGFPSSDFVMVAPFWADVDTRDSSGVDTGSYTNGQVLYKITDHALYLNWVDVGYFSREMDKRNSFQMIITDGTDPAIPGGNNVSFCYQDMQWTTGSASQGVNGFGGVSATVGVNRGDAVEHAQVGRFNADSVNYEGPYTEGSGINWLDSTHFYLNVSGTGVPPIFGSTFGCDTVVVGVNGGGTDRDLTNYRLFVLPGRLGEQVSCVASAPTLPNFQPIDVLLADHHSLDFTIDVAEATPGTHFITFTATNDQTQPLTSEYILQVEMADVSNSITQAADAQPGLQLAPNPATESTVLTWAADVRMTSVQVLAADGRCVLTLRPNARDQRAEISLESLPAGSYTLRATTNGGVLTQRLVKNAQ